MRILSKIMEVNEKALNVLIMPMVLYLVIIGFISGFCRIMMWSSILLTFCNVVWWIISVIGIIIILISYIYNHKN